MKIYQTDGWTERERGRRTEAEPKGVVVSICDVLYFAKTPKILVTKKKGDN